MLVDGAQSVGAIPVAAAGLDYLTISGQKWLCGPDATGALVVADPDGLAVSAPSYFSQAEYEPDGQFEPKPGAARFDPGWWPASSLAGLLAALDSRPAWAFDHAAAVAERCRELLADRVEVVSPAERERSTLVAFRAAGDPAEIVEALHARRRPRARDPGHGPDPRLVRLVDVGRRPRPPARRAARVTPQGACPCGAVRFTIDGPVRDVIVCHCDACREATGGPWPASAADRRDLAVEDEARSIWERAAVSEHGASRGRCRACGTVVFWDAPGRDTVSFARGAARRRRRPRGRGAHLGAGERARALATAGVPVEPQGCRRRSACAGDDDARTTG